MDRYVKINSEKLAYAMQKLEEKMGEASFGEGMNVVYPETKIIDGTEDTLNTVLDFLDNNEEILVEVQPKKVENNSGSNSKLFEQLKPIFEDPHNYVFGHGTLEEESAKGIIEEGLKARITDLGASFIGLDELDEALETMQNWPHLNAKYIVLAGFEDVRTMPFWKTRESEHQFDLHCTLDRARIIGYVDVNNQRFISSPYYEKTQTYNPEYPCFEHTGFSFNYSIDSQYSKILGLLVWIKNYDNIQDGKIRRNIYDGITAQIKECIEQIKNKIVVEGITREEYEKQRQEMLRVNNVSSSTVSSIDDLELSVDGSDWDLWFDDEITDTQNNQNDRPRHR